MKVSVVPSPLPNPSVKRTPCGKPQAAFYVER